MEADNHTGKLNTRNMQNTGEHKNIYEEKQRCHELFLNCNKMFKYQISSLLIVDTTFLDTEIEHGPGNQE
jgi:hypothetical protein